MITVERKHALFVRWNHWVNFPLLCLMVVSGLMIYWSHDAYLLPSSWLEAIGLGRSLALGMALHFAFAVFYAINGVSYVVYLIYSGDWRYLFPNRSTPFEALQVLKHDLKLSAVVPPRPIKYNGAQRLAYTSVIFLGMGSVLTGVAIYKPVQLHWLTSLLGGYKAARLEHFLITVAFVGFFFVHVAQVVRAGWNGFRAMVTGLEKVDVQD